MKCEVHAELTGHMRQQHRSNDIICSLLVQQVIEDKGDNKWSPPFTTAFFIDPLCLTALKGILATPQILPLTISPTVPCRDLH